MWQSTETIDQADAYGKNLLAGAPPKMSEVDKFNLLRSLSVTTAGIRAHGEGTMSKEQLETRVLTYYHGVIKLDLARHKGGLSGNLTEEIME